MENMVRYAPNHVLENLEEMGATIFGLDNKVSLGFEVCLGDGVESRAIGPTSTEGDHVTEHQASTSLVSIPFNYSDGRMVNGVVGIFKRGKKSKRL
ncbi:unnamed protein product [Lupinus luteus]|uniref:Uncharacterized protein n=1 Tax=Lupinus luteus TaxID=3873 RepID=A0AAV1VQR7_LUPLU